MPFRLSRLKTMKRSPANAAFWSTEKAADICESSYGKYPITVYAFSYMQFVDDQLSGTCLIMMIETKAT